MQHILVVEDEPTVRDVVVRYLQREDYRVSVADNGVDGLRLALERQPDLVVLDLMLPRLDGLEVVRKLRETRTTPVVMLTAKSEDHDVVLGLGLGADDYIRKPFSPGELVARVKAVLRRGTLAQGGSGLSFGVIRVDAQRRAAWRGQQRLELTATEFDLLWHLARHPGQVFTREQLLTSVWGYDYAGDAGTVTVHVRRLREKVEPDPSHPQFLKTVWGIGYKLEAN